MPRTRSRRRRERRLASAREGRRRGTRRAGVWVLLAGAVALAGVGLALRWARDSSGAPRLALLLSPRYGAESAAALRGEPLRVTVRLRCPDGTPRAGEAPTPAADAARRRTEPLPEAYWGWTERLSLRFYRALGVSRREVLEDLSWTDLVTPHERGVAGTLTSAPGEAVLSFVLPADRAGSLQPGSYFVEAVLDTREEKRPGRWQGSVSARSPLLSIREPGGSAERSRLLTTQAEAAFTDEKDYPKAERLAAEAVRLRPESAVAWKWLGAARASNKNYEEAVVAYEKFVALGGVDDLNSSQTPVRQRILILKRWMEMEKARLRPGESPLKYR